MYKENHQLQIVYQDCMIKTALYRLIFFGFGLFFLYLCFALYQRSVLSSCQMYLSHCSEIKGLLTTICLIFSICSLTICYILRGNHETAKRLVEKSQHELTALYQKKIKETSLEERAVLKACYQHLWTEMDALKAATCKKLHRVEGLSFSREVRLKSIAEALEHLRNELAQLIDSFS